MHVAVDRLRVDLEKENRGGMQPLGKDAVARLAERQGENGASDDPPVHEGHLPAPVAPPFARSGDPSMHAHSMALKGRNLDQFSKECLPVQIAESHGQILRGGQTEDLTVVPPADKGNPGMCDRQNLDLLQQICSLGLLAPEEFAAGGDVEKEVGHLDGGAGSIAGILHPVDLPASHLDQRPRLILPAARGEAEPGDTRDAGHGLAAESEGGDGGEVAAIADLAGGVTLEAEKRVGTIHPRSVVGHPDQARPAALELDRDAAGPGIDGVLHQFLDHGGWALDNLSGGHLAG